MSITGKLSIKLLVTGHLLKSIYLYPASDRAKRIEIRPKDMNINASQLRKETPNVLDRSELQGQSIELDDHFAKNTIEGPQSVHERIRSWLEDSDRIQNETESMATLVPIVENQVKTKTVSIRRRKNFSSNGNDVETSSEISSSDLFDNSIVPLKRAKKDRPSERSMEPRICSSTTKNKRKKIGRTFWNDEEDDCLKQGLLNYGPETKNRWATIKCNCFAKKSFLFGAC